MSFTDGLLLKRLGIGILSFTGALVGLLTLWIFASAYSSEPEAEQVVDRTPSSLPVVVPMPLKIDKSDLKVETLTIGCLKNGAQIELKSWAKLVRVKGRLCEDSPIDPAASSLLNRANGFEATLFKLENGSFTSDYIALAEGANKLMLQVDNVSGRRAIAELTISQSR